ncbi:hypothetical protein [Actinomyces sp. W5033]|uniref:hypothetical protein n=1 Tax=Actinomyces sp. W5033 TaxID=3446479 RepID=UPI003EDF3692
MKNPEHTSNNERKRQRAIREAFGRIARRLLQEDWNPMPKLATRDRVREKDKTETFEEKRARILKRKLKYKKDSRKRFVPATNYRNAPRQTNTPIPKLTNSREPQDQINDMAS